MTKERKEILFKEAEHFFEQSGGMLNEVQNRIANEPEPDKLDILVGVLCMPDYGGTEAARSILEIIGATEKEIQSLIGQCFDMYF